MDERRNAAEPMSAFNADTMDGGEHAGTGHRKGGVQGGAMGKGRAMADGGTTKNIYCGIASRIMDIDKGGRNL